jgi:hypothetical protein
MSHKREAIECFVMDDLPRAGGRCDPSTALGTGLVKVSRDELVMVLGR